MTRRMIGGAMMPSLLEGVDAGNEAAKVRSLRLMSAAKLLDPAHNQAAVEKRRREMIAKAMQDARIQSLLIRELGGTKDQQIGATLAGQNQAATAGNQFAGEVASPQYQAEQAGLMNQLLTLAMVDPRIATFLSMMQPGQFNKPQPAQGFLGETVAPMLGAAVSGWASGGFKGLK